MKLFELIKSNKSLVFVDFLTNENFTNLSEIEYTNQLNVDGKQLIFLYVDNSLLSIKAYLHFLSSPHVIALLSNSINSNLKESLEDKYKPYCIVDFKREAVEEYSFLKNYLGLIDIHINSSNESQSISEELKLLLSTSGTTGSPKFVKLSEENLIANAESIIDYLPIHESDVTPLNLPIHYSYGLSILHTNCIKGGTVICSLPDIMDKKFWVAQEDLKFTSLAGVPFVYEMLKRIGFTKKTYPSLRYLTQAGGKLNEDLILHYHNYAKESNIHFYVMYGQTEATARMSFLHPEFIENKIGSIGKAIKNGEFQLEEHSNQLIYTGDNVFGGYAESLEDLYSYDSSNTLYTGDVAKIDTDGFVYIVGRLKRFVKVFGNRVNLDEIEQMLKNNFENTSFISFGLNDQFIFILYNNSQISKEDIVEFLKSEYSIHHSCIKTDFISEIPLSSNGKVDYSKLIEMYGVN